jgi:hypothetical protein
VWIKINPWLTDSWLGSTASSCSSAVYGVGYNVCSDISNQNFLYESVRLILDLGLLVIYFKYLDWNVNYEQGNEIPENLHDSQPKRLFQD